MENTLTGNPKKLDVVIINDEAETPSLLNPMSGQIFVTNRVGKRIMELADGSRDLEGIVEEVTRQFKGTPRAVVEQDAGSFLREATEKGLVSWLGT